MLSFKMMNITKEAKAFIFFILACFLFALLNCMIRWMSFSMDVYIMTFYRSLFCITLSSVFLIFTFWQTKRVDKFNKINLLKGTVDFIGIPLWSLAVSKMNMSAAVSLSFTVPLFSALLAIIFLKEKLSIEKWLAIFIGFAGAYIIVLPHVYGFHPYAFIVLMTCVLWASANVMTKNLATKQHPLFIVLYVNIIICLFSSPFFIKNLYTGNIVTLNQIIGMFVLAVLAFGAHLSLAYSYTYAKISSLLPLDYMRLVFTAILSYIVFGEVAEFNVFIGSLIILSSVIYLMSRQMQKNKLVKESQ
jgi:drug/metabolite transporter (DMT)-like permease